VDLPRSEEGRNRIGEVLSQQVATNYLLKDLLPKATKQMFRQLL